MRNLESHLCDGLQRGRVLEQQVHGPHVVLLAGNMERSEAILETERERYKHLLLSHMNHIQTQVRRLNTYESTSVGLGPLIQEDFGHPMVTAVGCYMKGGQMVQRDVVDLSVVLQ